MVLVGDLCRAQRSELAVLGSRELNVRWQRVCGQHLQRKRREALSAGRAVLGRVRRASAKRCLPHLSAGGVVCRRRHHPIVRRLVGGCLRDEYRRSAVHVPLGVHVLLLLGLMLMLLQDGSGRAAERRVGARLMLTVHGRRRGAPGGRPGRRALGVSMRRRSMPEGAPAAAASSTATTLMLCVCVCANYSNISPYL